MIRAVDPAEGIRRPEFRAGTRLDERTGFRLRTVFCVLASGACYYVATWIAWSLCLPDSKVSLFFPPHAVLVSILLLVPTRHWWAYTLAAHLADLPDLEMTLFDDRFDAGEIVFDFRMKPGPVTRSNALALMRSVGLDIGSDDTP